jgi:hypothetical protein
MLGLVVTASNTCWNVPTLRAPSHVRHIVMHHAKDAHVSSVCKCLQVPLLTDGEPSYVEQLCLAVLAEFEVDSCPLLTEPVAVVLACCGQRLLAASAPVRQRLVSIVLKQFRLLPELQDSLAKGWRHDLALGSSTPFTLCVGCLLFACDAQALAGFTVLGASIPQKREPIIRIIKSRYPGALRSL